MRGARGGEAGDGEEERAGEEREDSEEEVLEGKEEGCSPYMGKYGLIS